MYATEFHEHMQKHLANKDFKVDESGIEEKGVNENIESTDSAKDLSPSNRATDLYQQNSNTDNQLFDFTKKQEFRLDSNENEDSSEEAESITPNFVGITRKLIDCHMCSATGMTADQFFNHMLKHQAKAGFAVDSSAVEEEQNRRFGDPMDSKDEKKTTHLFSRESSDFSYVDRMLETNEFKKIIKGERKRADISHSYDDRLDPDDSTEFNNSTETSQTKKRQKRAYEILIPKDIRDDENTAERKWRQEKDQEEAEDEREFENKYKNRTSEERFMKREEKRKAEFYKFFNEKWDELQKLRSKREINGKVHHIVKRAYEILIPKDIRDDENTAERKWRQEKDQEEAEDEREFENKYKNRTSEERFMKREEKRKAEFYKFFNEKWDELQKLRSKREINGKVHHIVKRAYEILIPKDIRDDENTAERKWRQEKDQEEAEDDREFENKYKNRTSEERFMKREEKRKAEFYKFFNEKWDELQKLRSKREINGKVHHIVKRAYEILIPKDIRDDENTAERKWRQEKDQEEAEDEREFENKYKNRTSEERFIKREEKRKAEFYKFFNEKWEELQKLRSKREINGKVHHIVKRAYEILIPKDIGDDENTAERKWRQEKDQEEAEDEREFENKYKNRTSEERFMKREEKRKAEFYKFFNEKWEELQKNRAKRDVQRGIINLGRERARHILGKSKNKAFDIKNRMKRSETIFKCPVCSKKFKTHMRLNKHILNDHKPAGTTKSQRFTLHKKDYDIKELGEEYQNFDELKTREYEDDIPLNVEIKNVNHTLIPYHLVKGREYTPDERMEESFEDLGLGPGPTPAGFAKIHQDLKRIQNEDEKYNNAYMKMLFVTEKERTAEVTQAYDDYNIHEKIDKLFPSPKSNMKCTECGATFGSEMEADVHNFDHRMMPHIEYELFPDKFTKLTTPKIENLVLNHRALKKVATAGFWGYNKYRADRFNSSEEMRYKTMNWFEFDYNSTSEKPRRMIWNLRSYNRTLKTWEVIPNVTIPEVDRDPTVPKGKGTDYSEFSSYESISVDMKKKKSLEEVAREYLDSENPPNETFFQQSYFDADRNSSQIYGSDEFNEDESSLMHSREFDDIPSVLLRSDAEKQEDKNKISHKKHEANKIKGKQDKKQSLERHHKTKENLGPIDVYIKEREKEEMLERQKLANVRSKRRKEHHRNQNTSAVLDQFLDAEVEEKPSDPNQSPDPELPITSSLIQKYTGSSGSIYEHMNLTDYIKRKKISLLYDPDEVTHRNCTKPYKQYIRVSDYMREEIETEKKNRKEGIRAILSKYNITKYPDLDEYYKDDKHLINTKHDHHTTEKWHLTTKQIKSIEEIKRAASIEKIRRTDDSVSPVFGTRVVFQQRTVTFYGKGQYTYNGDKVNKINKIDNFMDEFQNDKGVNVWDTPIRNNDDILKRFQKSKKAQEERTKISTTKKKIHTPAATPHYQDTREEVTLHPSAEMRAGIDRMNEGLREKFAKTSSTTRKTRSTSITSTTPSTIDYREQDARFNHASFNDDHETTTLDDRFFAHGSDYDDMADIAENRFGLPGGGGGGKRGGNIVDELKHVDRALKLEEKQEPSEQNSQFEDDDPKSWQFAGGTWGPNENMCDYEQIKKDMTDYFELYLRPRNMTTVNYDGTDYCRFCNVTKMKNHIHVHDSQPECTEDHSAIVRNKSHTIFPLEFRLKKCNVCNKTFDIPIRDENYWNHVKSHNRPIISEKDFMYDAWNNYGQCSVCNKTFIPNDGLNWYLYHLYNHSEAGHICVNWTLDDYPYFSLPLNFTGDSYDSYDRYDDSALLFDMGGKNTKYSRYVTPGTVVTWYDEHNEDN